MDEGSKAARDFSSRGSRIEGSRAELNQQGEGEVIRYLTRNLPTPDFAYGAHQLGIR